MNVIEQTREIGLLQSIGMTRPQVRLTILCQGGLLVTVANVTGAVVGVVLARLINLCMMPLFGHPLAFKLEPAVLLGVPLLTVVIVMIASWLAGEKAVRLNIVSAMHYE